MDPPVSVPIAIGAWNDATAAADPPPEPPGMRVRSHGLCARAEGGVLRRRTHRELVHVGLAEYDDAGLAQAAGDRRVVRRHPALEDLRAARRRHALRGDDVLQREWHARERPQLLPCRAAVVDGLRRAERPVGADVQEGVHAVVDGGDAVEVGARRLHGADVARGDRRRGLGGREPGDLPAGHRAHPELVVVIMLPRRGCEGPGTGPARLLARPRAPPPG